MAHIPILRDRPVRQWIALMLVAVLVVEVVRVAWDRYLAWLRGPFGLEGIPMVGCPFLIISIASVAASLTLIVVSIYRTKNLLPTGVLLLGIFLAFQVPLPAPPPTPEETHFLTYRADYERVVTLARQHQLVQALPKCPYGYAPPSQYQHVSGADCIWAYNDPSEGLIVGFSPFVAYYYQIVYIENRVSPNDYSCYSDLAIEKRIDDHWYICIGQWN